MKTRGFWVQRIQADDLLGLEEEVYPLTPELQQKLEQPYTFLGAGSECFAFLSQDGTTVIKFFKLDQFRPVYLHRGLFCEDYSAYAGTIAKHTFPVETLPSWAAHLLKRLWGIREYRLQRTFESIQLAYHHLKEETGLLYLHLHPQGEFNPFILYDACGIAHSIDLHSTRFVLQKRGTSIEEHFSSLSEEKGKKSLNSLLALLRKRCMKGIHDRDIVPRNFGFLGTEAIEIDTGSFSSNPHMKEAWIYKQELFYATLDLKLWLEKTHPTLAPYLKEQMKEEYPRT
jgi:hypothetical protein